MTADGTAVRLLVTLDVVLRRDGGPRRLHARHTWCGRQVRAATADPAGLRTTTFDVGDWQEQLARAVPPDGPSGGGASPEPGLELPWDLVVGTGAALRHHRLDVYDVLVARADGAVTVGGRPVGPAEIRTQLRHLHGSVSGRLRCCGVVPSSRLAGWVSWLRYADGWRALVPCADAQARPMLRLEPRSPGDLGHEVARWAVAR